VAGQVPPEDPVARGGSPQGGADDRVDLLLQPAHRHARLVRGPAGAKRGRVQPERGQQRAQPVRQVRGHHPLGADHPATAMTGAALAAPDRRSTAEIRAARC
jgi:hypothetical protein